MVERISISHMKTEESEDSIEDQVVDRLKGTIFSVDNSRERGEGLRYDFKGTTIKEPRIYILCVSGYKIYIVGMCKFWISIMAGVYLYTQIK